MPRLEAAAYVSQQFLLVLEAGTYRTFPVPGTCSRKVPLFLVGSVFPYSKGEQGRYKGTLIFTNFPNFFKNSLKYFYSFIFTQNKKCSFPEKNNLKNMSR